MNLVIKTFVDEMIPEASQLLALRHRRNRTLLPLLPARFEDPSVAVKAVEALCQKKFKNGYAAFRDGRMVGYLLGDFTVQSWGRCGYVYLPGYALAEGEKTTVIQDLYCALGDDWVKQGVFSHNLYLSAADANTINAMFGLGFGKERVDALLELGPVSIPETGTPPGIIVRKAGAGDNDHLGGLSDVIMHSLANAPYWHPTLPEEWEELREGWAELADDKEWTVWLAMENNEALGMVGFCPEKESATSLLVSPRTVYLSVAATKLKARGRGISTSLTWQGLEQARKEGFEICYTNWVSPNLPASRFWPRFGFKDVAYRMSKQINPMIAWTRTR